MKRLVVTALVAFALRGVVWGLGVDVRFVTNALSTTANSYITPAKGGYLLRPRNTFFADCRYIFTGDSGDSR